MKSIKDLLYNEIVDLYQRSIDLADHYHRHQFRKVTGEPYINHIEDVDKRASNMFYSMWTEGKDGQERLIHLYVIKILSRLHDVLEDSKECTLEILRDEGFPEEILDSLVLLNFHRDKRPYNDKIVELKGDSLSHKFARFIKIMDNISNLADHPSEKQIFKYATSLRLLLYKDTK